MDLFLHSVSFWTNWPSLVLDFVTGAKCPIGMPCLSRISMQRCCFSFAMLEISSAKSTHSRVDSEVVILPPHRRTHQSEFLVEVLYTVNDAMNVFIWQCGIHRQCEDSLKKPFSG